MRSPYDRLELALGVSGLLASVAVLALRPASLSLSLPDLLRYAGVLLLAQSFVRDLYLLASGRAQRRPSAERRGWFICAESVLGLALVVQGLFLAALEVAAAPRLPTGAWLLLVSFWWIFGHAIRELVFELQRDPDHLNLLIGPPARLERPSHEGLNPPAAERPWASGAEG
jgi:hypothetical protein